MERYKTWIGVCGGIFLLFLIFQQWRIAVLRKVDAAHQKERETQATYSHLFNNMPILYMQERAVFDAQGTAIDTVYVDVNAYFERSFYRRDEVIGKSGATVFPESQSQFMPIIDIVLKEKRSITFPYYHKPVDIFYEVVICPSYRKDTVDIFCIDSTALHNAQKKVDSVNRKLALALNVANIIPWKWDLTNHTILVRPQQGGQDGRRNVAGKQRLACGGRGVLLLESPQGRPGTRPRSLQEPDRRAYGEGLRRVPRRIQRERALAHGVGRGTGHGRNPRLRWQAAVAGGDIARDLRTQTDGAGACSPHATVPKSRTA